MSSHLNYAAVLGAAVSLLALRCVAPNIFRARMKANGFKDRPPSSNPAKTFGISFCAA
jgi:hypothetical protein